MKKSVVVSLSGGMDSSTLLLKALKEYDSVTALSFYYGQKHKVELEKADSLVTYLKEKGFNLTYEVVRLEGLKELLSSSLVEGGEDVPEGHYEQENMIETVVPNRNKIFGSITQAVALSTVKKTEKPCDIALGIHAGDHFIYPDCRQEFRDADFEAFQIGNWDAEKVNYWTPYLNTDKLGILKDGEKLCEELGLDFDEVYKRTNTSYKPIWIPDKDPGIVFDTQPGKWYSDYKSASSVERVEAFINLGKPDPVPYADESGPVTWEVVVEHVEGVLKGEK